jgi:hypothetical protein
MVQIKEDSMTTRAFFATAAAILAAAALAPAAHAQNLAGSQVTAAGYCCTAPTPANQATNAATATVGPTTEFPQGSFTSLTSGLATVPVAIDVGSNDIELNYTAGGVAAPGGFNGYVFTFANAPAITGVTLDPRSSSGYTPALSFSGNQIFVNEAGLTLTSTTMGLLAVTTATAPPPPVPEPETYAMLLGGLALLGWTARRRRG